MRTAGSRTAPVRDTRGGLLGCPARFFRGSLFSVLVVGLAGGPALLASPQEKSGAPGDPGGSGAQAAPAAPGAETAGAARREALPPAHRPELPGTAPPDWYQRFPYRSYGLYSPYYIPTYGWWGGWYIPQTLKYKDYYYPPPVALEPRLGLHYNYPFAWQAGIQIPPDSDPLLLPDLGPFVGIVGPAKAEAAAREAGKEGVEARNAVPPDAGAAPAGARDGAVAEVDALERQALALMKEGKYREAGKLLARCFEVTEAPRYPLLLSEVFFALGKYEHANLLLRHGLETKGGFEALPGDVAAHFPSREVFEAKLKELEGKNVDATLLRSYLLLHAREPQEGFEILKDRLKEKPDDRIALRLYRRYLERTF